MHAAWERAIQNGNGEKLKLLLRAAAQSTADHLLSGKSRSEHFERDINQNWPKKTPKHSGVLYFTSTE